MFQKTSSHHRENQNFQQFPKQTTRKTPSPGGMIHKIRENQKRSGDPSNQRGLSKKSWWEESTNLIWDLNQTSFHGKRKWLMTQLKPTYVNIYITYYWIWFCCTKHRLFLMFFDITLVAPCSTLCGIKLGDGYISNKGGFESHVGDRTG